MSYVYPCFKLLLQREQDLLKTGIKTGIKITGQNYFFP